MGVVCNKGATNDIFKEWGGGGGAVRCGCRLTECCAAAAAEREQERERERERSSTHYCTMSALMSHSYRLIRAMTLAACVYGTAQPPAQ